MLVAHAAYIDESTSAITIAAHLQIASDVIFSPPKDEYETEMRWSDWTRRRALEREQRIRQRAYSIWEASGRPDGQEIDHWDLAIHRDRRERFWNAEAWALRVRRPAQYLIGLAIFILLIVMILYQSEIIKDHDWMWKPLADLLTTERPIALVGKGLAISAGVDLAYMLFTPGPDEALEPVMLGIASTVLLLISNAEHRPLYYAIVVLLLAVSLAGLFLVWRHIRFNRKGG
jgi:hypothetical protein